MTAPALTRHEQRRAEEYLHRTAAQCAAWSALGMVGGFLAGLIAGVLG